MKKITILLSLALLVFLGACTQENITPVKDTVLSLDQSSERLDAKSGFCFTKTTSFIAGQNIQIGNITVSNNDKNLYVTFNAVAPWVMGKTHLYVGALANIPAAKNGNPKIGNFPYQTTHNPMTNTFTYTIPLNTLGSCFIVAAHSEVHKLGANGTVIQSETGWGSGTQFNSKGSWAMYIDYCVKRCQEI